MDDASRRRKQRRERLHQPNKVRTGIIMKSIFGPNWKTTQAGIAAIGAGLAILGTSLKDGAQIGDVNGIMEAVGLIAGGLGLIFARDRNVSSEESGAK